jgi:potassium/hydrogen antiporter
LFDSISIALAISALIILIGFLANSLFKKTGLPDMLILIFLGVLFGPILGVFNPGAVKSFAPFIAALALAYILFDGGMGLNIRKVVFNSPRAVLLAVLGFVFSVLGVGALMIVAFNVPVVYGLLFGSIFGGSSSVAVISLASKIKISEKGATVLILESAITDILCIVISLSLIDVVVTGQADVGSIGLSIAGKFLIGAGVGLVLGLVWLFALKRVSTLPFSYMLTLGIVLLGYAVSEGIGGSGALSALLFGLILGNEGGILKVFSQNGFISNNGNNEINLSVSEGLKRFEAEIAFLIRTFFFVFLGIIVSISSWITLTFGVILSIILLATRFGAVWITTLKSSMQNERPILTVILTRGLAAAVLATLPAQYGLSYSDLFVDLAVVVIVTTAIIATIGSIWISRKETGTIKLGKLRDLFKI